MTVSKKKASDSTPKTAKPVKAAAPKTEKTVAPKTAYAKPAKSDLQKMQMEEAIRNRAYEIWEEEGRPHGSHLEHWLRAKKEIAGE